MPQSLEAIVGPAAWPLRLGLTAFALGLCGVAFGFAIDYGPHNPLSFLAFTVVALAVFLGFVSLAWGWLAIYLYHRKKRSAGE